MAITLQEINEFHVKQMGAQYAPANGICWGCRLDIYDAPDLREEAMREARTGCPHCHYSFVE
jgi:hypothetical protein